MHDRLELLHVAIGVLDGGALGSDHEREEEAAIVRRDELSLECIEQQHGTRREDGAAADHEERPGQRPLECATVPRGDAIEHASHEVVEARLARGHA
jgi:hypothetical protein